MVCRHVSKQLRAEAERDFAQRRLRKIYFKWKFTIAYEGCEDDGLYWCSGHCEMIRLCKYSDDGERAFFDVQVKDDAFHDPWSILHGQDFKMELRREDLRQRIRKDFIFSETTLSSSKSNLHPFDDDRYPYRQPRFVVVGSYVNEVEIPGLRIEVGNKRLSLLWKQFLTDYFLEEAYVRKMRRESGLRYNEAPIMEDMREYKQLALNNDGVDSDARRFFKGEVDIIGNFNAELYARAFTIRSQKAYAHAGVEIELSQDIEKRRLQRLRCARRRQLYDMETTKNERFWPKGQDDYEPIY